MAKFRVTATMDVSYEAEIEAPTSQDAWNIAANDDGDVNWFNRGGDDWELQSIIKVKE
jgi:hypothetical protein